MTQPAVLVTGGARRVGAAIVRALHAAGASVIVHCHRSCADAERLLADLENARAGSTAIVQADLLDTPRLPRLVEEAAARFGRLDGLVNNASSFHATPFDGLEAEAWEDLVGTNLRAPLFLSKAAALHLRASRGAIVNIVDIHAERPLAGFLAYSVAKSGLAGLTRALALELAPEVRVNGVSPGAILWPEDGEAFPPGERERITVQTPLRRTGSPEDVAGAVKYLLFDAPFVTGQVLAVDGGRSIAL
ncbi:MAG TPA: pteridine reductase [Usitatibacteraceae bacterium]|nr:pteridine reductase [Usitatibacteraceae bacterium]